MKILVSGSTGLIGSSLIPLLESRRHQVYRLVRSKPHPGDIFWDPAENRLDAAHLEGFDAVIHLAGDPIAEGRWTEEKKARIRDSRVKGTRLLSESLAKLSNPPKTLLCASAVGYYGHRGEESLHEGSAAGSGFFADVGKAWEAAADPARGKGIRVVHLRFGIVLTPTGGALKKMLPPFRLGLGGSFGSGRQYMSWIELEDALSAIYHTLMTHDLEGPVNIVSPLPLTNRDFSHTLGRELGLPVLFRIPAFAVRLLFGEMADEALLASTRAEPRKLLDSGFKFRYNALDTALKNILR